MRKKLHLVANENVVAKQAQNVYSNQVKNKSDLGNSAGDSSYTSSSSEESSGSYDSESRSESQEKVQQWKLANYQSSFKSKQYAMMALKLQMLRGRHIKSVKEKYFGILKSNVPRRSARSKMRDKERRSNGRDKSPRKKQLLQNFGRARNPSQISMKSEFDDAAFGDINTHRSKAGNQKQRVPNFNPQDRKPRLDQQP